MIILGLVKKKYNSSNIDQQKYSKLLDCQIFKDTCKSGQKNLQITVNELQDMHHADTCVFIRYMVYRLPLVLFFLSFLPSLVS